MLHHCFGKLNFGGGKRYATFKIEYYPHTPDEYEPPRFMPAPEERREMLFSTHDVSESPVRVRIGKVETGYNKWVSIILLGLLLILGFLEASLLKFTPLPVLSQQRVPCKTRCILLVLTMGLNQRIQYPIVPRNHS